MQEMQVMWIQSLGWEETLEKEIATSLSIQLVKNPPAMWETWVPSLGREDPLEKGTHSNILA